MSEMFPMMFDRPEGRTVVGGALYWVVYMIGLPFVMALMGPADTPVLQFWLLYGVSFVAVGLIFLRYLKESFFNVRCYPKRFFATVGIAVAAVLTVELSVLIPCMYSQDMNVVYAVNNILPFAEAPLMMPLASLTVWSPFWTTVCSVVFVPLTMCCLYYGVGFAPAAVERPWLGYVIVVVLSAVPRLFGLGNTGFPLYQLLTFLLQLPWHLCACWAYQKTDTIWAPITVYTIINLLSSLAWTVLA